MTLTLHIIAAVAIAAAVWLIFHQARLIQHLKGRCEWLQCDRAEAWTAYRALKAQQQPRDRKGRFAAK